MSLGLIEVMMTFTVSTDTYSTQFDTYQSVMFDLTAIHNVSCHNTSTYPFTISTLGR